MNRGVRSKTKRTADPPCSISVGICWYNDETVFRCIESIPKDWNIIIAYGLFRNSKLKEDLAQLERIKLIPNVQVVYADGETPEYKIRDLYLRNSKGMDILIIIDSDEYISELKDEFYDNIKDLGIGLYGINVKYDVIREWAKIIVNPFMFHYEGSHKLFKALGQTYPINRYIKLINGLTLTHDDSVRNSMVKDSIEEYQKQMWVNGE